MLKLLPTIVKHLHYHTTVEALLVVIDSDDSMPHGAHAVDLPDDCRLCRVRSVLEAEMLKLTSVTGKPGLKTAVGLCVPAIEAWYLCGVDPAVTEAAWIVGRNSGHLPYSRQELKRRAYGSTVPTLDIQTQRAISHAQRLAADLTLLHTWFPSGCGTMLNAVTSWAKM